MSSRDKKPTFDPEYIRDLSVLVYMARLADESGADAVDRMIEKDGDGGKKLRGRAAAYDPLTRAYLKALGIFPDEGAAHHIAGVRHDGRLIASGTTQSQSTGGCNE